MGIEDQIIRSRLPSLVAACLLAMLIGCQPEVGMSPDELPDEENTITIGGAEIQREESTLNSLTTRIEDIEVTNGLLVNQLLDIQTTLKGLRSEIKVVNARLDELAPLKPTPDTKGESLPTTPEKIKSLQNLELKLTKAVQTRDVDLLLQLFPSREIYREIYSRRRLLTPDRLEQDDLDEAYQTFFDRYDETLTELRSTLKDELRLFTLDVLEHVRTADLTRLVGIGPSISPSLVSDLRRNAQRNSNSVYAGIFSELRSPSDPVLQNIGSGALIFISERKVLVVQVELIEINGGWYVMSFTKPRPGYFYFRDSLVEEFEESNLRFLSDNGQFFMDLFTQVKQGELVPLLPYIPPPADGLNSTDDPGGGLNSSD